MAETRLYTASPRVKPAVILGAALQAAGIAAEDAREQTGGTWRALNQFVEDHLSSKFAEGPTGN